ncbi:MAG: esterase-like activity of phytase family protein, partial [Ilumatobacter sp.]
STLFTALRGQAAFARDSDSSVLPQIHRILTESPPDLRPSGVPDEVAVILEQAMSKSPDQRPASAAAFGAAMQAIQASLGVGVSELVVAAERATDTPSEPPTAAAVTFPASDSDAKPFEPVAPWSDGVVPPPSAPEPVQPESGPTPDQWWSPVDDRTELASRPGPQPPAPRPPAPQPPAPQPPGPPVSVADVPAASDRSSGRSRKGLVSVGIAAFVVVAVGVGVVATRGGDERPQEAVDDTRPGTDVDTLPGTGADTVASGFTVEPTVVTTEPAVVTTTPGPPIIDELESLGSVAFAADTEVDDLVFSGISALSAGGQDGRYFGFRTNPRAGADLPDSMFAPVVFELDVDIADGALEPGDVSIVGTREVTGPDGEPYGPELDVEGLTQLDDGSFVLVSEHEPGQPSEMFVDHLGSDWTFIDRFALPDWYRSTGDENVGFKAAAAWPGRPGLVIVATEIPVPSDRVAGDRGGVKVARLLAFDVESGEAVAEWGYPLEALDDDVLPEQTDLENVLVELIAVDDSSLLVIERSSSTGTPRLAYYQVDLDDGVAPLVATPPLLEKRLVLDARTGGGAGDVNLQNVAVGPDLADGRSTLITMTDNGFRDQSTLVQALALGTRQ